MDNEADWIWESWNEPERHARNTDVLIFGNGFLEEIGRGQHHVPIQDVIITNDGEAVVR